MRISFMLRESGLCNADSIPETRETTPGERYTRVTPLEGGSRVTASAPSAPVVLSHRVVLVYIPVTQEAAAPDTASTPAQGRRRKTRSFVVASCCEARAVRGTRAYAKCGERPPVWAPSRDPSREDVGGPHAGHGPAALARRLLNAGGR